MVERMLGSVRYETFYTQAVHPDYDLGIFAGCVAMSGSLSDGQPFLSQDGNVILLLSGECFMDSDTKAQVSRRTDRSGASSASSLPDLYEVRGDGTRKA